MNKITATQSGTIAAVKLSPAARKWRAAVIDIGSNSVRLVVYSGPRRNPAMIFNEKVMAGLGRDVPKNGRIDDEAMARAIGAVRRFILLARDMLVDEIICVATSAVRDAENGAEFAAQIDRLGIKVEILAGEDEAHISALGVISAIPDANGIVGDLGGGSLDMARVKQGKVIDTLSLPLGVLRLNAQHDGGKYRRMDDLVLPMLKAHGWLKQSSGLPFYLVGGSWRAVARFNIYLSHYPVATLHQYQMAPERIKELYQAQNSFTRDELCNISTLPTSRIEHLGNALRLLEIVGGYVGACYYRVSAYGLREGLLYRTMSSEVRQSDPLLVSTRSFGMQHGRHQGDGTRLYRWLKGIFAENDERNARWLEAACHLADSGWEAGPDYRADRAMFAALHGPWVGVDMEGRCMMAQSLFTGLGGGNDIHSELRLTGLENLRQAMHWGLAIRMGMRLGAGCNSILERSKLFLEKGALILELQPDDADIYGEVVEKRFKKLANALDSDEYAVRVASDPK